MCVRMNRITLGREVLLEQNEGEHGGTVVVNECWFIALHERTGGVLGGDGGGE